MLENYYWLKYIRMKEKASQQKKIEHRSLLHYNNFA